MFNENEYKREWKKENMGIVKASFKKDFVDQFKEACKSLGISQSDVIRNAMEEVINRAQNKEKLL